MTSGPVVGKRLIEALVGGAKAETAAADQDVDDQMPEQDRERQQDQQAGEQRQREDDDGMAIAEGGGKAIGVATWARGEQRERPASRFHRRRCPRGSPLCRSSARSLSNLHSNDLLPDWRHSKPRRSG